MSNNLGEFGVILESWRKWYQYRITHLYLYVFGGLVPIVHKIISTFIKINCYSNIHHCSYSNVLQK